MPGLALELHGVRFFVTEASPVGDFPWALLPGEAALGERLLLRTLDGAVAVERAQLSGEPEPGESPSPSDALGDGALSGAQLVGLLRDRQPR